MDLVTLLSADLLGKPAWLWAAFLALVGVLLAFDLGVLNRQGRELGVAESLKLSVFYIAVAVAFGGWIWWSLGAEAGLQYFTGYAIEKALSIDNVFVISLIFGFFAIPARYQYRALVWGILAVIVLRGLMIGIGAALVQQYAWVLLLFGLFLIATGLKMMWAGEATTEVAANPLVRLLSRRLRVTRELHGDRFFVRQPDPATGRLVRHATPLFLALVVINVADLVFAVDSVPAIFAITTDTYIVFTANIMAILGLRALYFALAASVQRFRYLKYALALVLVFIGLKIFWNHFFGKLDPAISLSVTLAIIAAGIAVSMWKTRGAAGGPVADLRTGPACGAAQIALSSRREGNGMNQIDLNGHVAVVTGGAQGIGQAVVERFAASGATVEIWDLDGDLAAETAAAVGHGAKGRAVDVTDAAGVTAAAKDAEAAHGPIDILVTSAGIAGPNTSTWDYPLADWGRIMRINVDGTFHCCRALLPSMIAQGYGRIVTIASVAGKEGNPNASAYSASKAAVIALTKSMGKELAGHDIAVNTITPAAARTRIFDQMTPEHVNFMLAKIPRGRFVEPREIAAMVAWLCSAENSFTTGAVFDLSGGRATY